MNIIRMEGNHKPAALMSLPILFKFCSIWYLRRTDPTAGHIMTGMKGLLPPSLPPLSVSLSSGLSKTDDPLDEYLKNRPIRGKPLPSIDSSLAQSSVASNSMLSSSADQKYRPMGDRNKPNDRCTQSAGSNDMIGEQYGKEDYYDEEAGNTGDERYSYDSEYAESFASSDEAEPNDMKSEIGSEYSHEMLVNDVSSDELFLLSARPFALPFESKSCMVQVFSSKEYDENLRLRVVTSGLTHDILAERLVPIDKAYEIINAGGHSSQIVHSTDSEDLQSLSTLLINMFKEADEDGSGKFNITQPILQLSEIYICTSLGSLTFDEFQALMEQVELGISSQELRFVISEADENENGVVDYEEFVPLAVDLIQSFRARNRAKALNSHEDVMVDDLIFQSISTEELQKSANACLEKIYEIDTKRYGLIRAPELKKALHSVAAAVGIRDNEIGMLCQMLPRDQFGRVKYNATPTAFYETLGKVRFMTMKNAMIEAQGSGLQKYLLDLCKEEEMKTEGFKGPKEKFVPNGIISCRSLINILSNSSRLSLSRLQVLVIMSEASVLDGMINYFQFVPVVAKAIEIMFEPKALRQRAELIEKTDLSPEALLQGMSSDMFEQRLLTLFKSYDIDHNGLLDQNEFIACLESLDLQLTYGEMVALMAAADTEQHGYLKFEEFVGFFTHNLLNLEREKRLRLLQSSMQNDGGSNAQGNKKDEQEQDLITRLMHLFQLYDPEDTGFIRFEDFDSILHNFSLHSSKFLMDLMISELQVNDDGLVEYSKSLKLCGDLLKVFKAKESALEEHRQKEAEAEAKALKFAQVSVEETNRIVKYLRHKIKEISELQIDPFSKYSEIQNAIRAPHSGLSKSEANMIIAKLFMGISTSKIANENANTSNGTSPADRVPLRHSAKSFKFAFSPQELFDAVFDARKTTIMRTLLRDNIDTSSTKQLILSGLQREVEHRRKRGELHGDLSFLPVPACFDVLDNLRQFRLTRAQIMFIISYADCYDRDGTSLDIYRFADHAASIVSNMNTVEVMETRAEVINHSSIDDRKVLHGMQEKELVRLLEYSFSKIVEANNAVVIPSDFEEDPNAKDQVTGEQVRQVLKELSRLKLTEREISIILVNLTALPQKDDASQRLERSMSGSGDLSLGDNSHHAGIAGSVASVTGSGAVEPALTYNWREIVQQIVESIRTLKRETMIHRRVSLAATSLAFQGKSTSQETKKLQEESIKQMKDVAEKLLNFVKLLSQGDSIMISLPLDGTQRRSSQMVAETHIKLQNQEITSLFRGALFLPIITHRLVGPPSVSPPRQLQSPAVSARNNSSRASAQIETIQSRIAVFLQLDAMEDTQMFSGCSMFVNVVSHDGSITLFEQLPVKLPSLGLVDREAAQQYATNLVEKMYFEINVGDSKPILKMVE